MLRQAVVSILLIVLACTVLAYVSAESIAVNKINQTSKALSAAQLSPSLILLGAGARWAGSTGNSALYVNWYDNAKAHPNLYTPPLSLMQCSRAEVSRVLEGYGYSVTFAADIPDNISGYDVLVVDSYYACEPAKEPIVRSFISDGGGVVLIGAAPRYLSIYCKDMWPGHDLDLVQDWFGADFYGNTGGYASISVNKPFGSSFSTGDSLGPFLGESHAAVADPLSDSMVIAEWENGFIFSLSHEYGYGRMYYQAVYDVVNTLVIASVSQTPIVPEYNSHVNIRVGIQNETQIDHVILSYTQDSSWNNVTMTENNGIFSAIIPAQPYGTLVQYEIYVGDTGGNWVVSTTYSYTVSDLTRPEILGIVITPLQPTNNDITKIDISISEPENASGLNRVLFSFTDNFGQQWNTTMTYDRLGNVWETKVPELPSGTNVQFFILANDNAGNYAIERYSYAVT